ncbi:MAG: DUF3047 domain-containing protein [Candidatus Omnitrophota bacterium]
MRRIRKYIYALIVFLVILCVGVYGAYALNFPKWFPFNRKNALEEWQEKVFKDKVLYVVEPRMEGGYLSANSKEACSGLLYRIKFDPRDLPMMSWQWKVTKFPDQRMVSETGGGWVERDDYAARVYVIFTSWNFLNIKSLEYVWAEDIAEGTVLTSPYFKNLKLIVAESGTKNLNNWVFEERNIREDYQKAFGHAPSRPVTAIALMTDSDNTLSTAEALYKDIKVGYKNEQTKR